MLQISLAGCFSASDVLRPDRELYFRTLYRTIPNVKAKPVKLYPVVNLQTNRLTDISDCILQGVPRVHIKYLQKMGVAASMSTPVMWIINCRA